jgi:hypothetical protein
MDFFNFSQQPNPPDILQDQPVSTVLAIAKGISYNSHPLSGGVNPAVGATKDTYTYSVVYTGQDNNPTITVNVDGTSYAMTKSITTKEGVLYRYQTTLAQGTNHQFSFTSVDSSGTHTIPDNGVLYSGPQVFPFRITASLSPNTALPGQKITYSAIYQDFAGLAPTQAEVDINGARHPLVKTSGTNYKTGVTYTYTTTSLPIGAYFHQWVFDDGSGLGPAIFLSSSRPYITPLTLTNSQVTPTSGGSSTTFTFSTTYTQMSGDAPSSALVYIDGKSYPMTCTSNCTTYTNAIYQYQTQLPSGKHAFYFVFNDTKTHPQSAWADPFNPYAYCGPNVGAQAQPIPRGAIVMPSDSQDAEDDFSSWFDSSQPTCSS